MTQQRIKHIFYIHSNITQLVAEAYILKYNLNEDSHIIYPKRYKPKTNLNADYFPYFDELYTYNIPGNNFLRKKKQCKEILGFISRINNGSKFIFYIPHLNINTLRVVISHPECIDFMYLEEGILSYSILDDINFFMPSKKFTFFQSLGFGFSMQTAFPDLNRTGICLNSNAFPFLRNKIILERNIIELLLQSKEQYKNINFDNQAILVFDSSVENKMVTIQEYLCSIIDSICFIQNRGIKKLYYKFHPDQLLFDFYKYFKYYLESGVFSIEVEEIPQETSLELVFMSAKNITVLHTMSSLGYYANVFGHFTFSNAESLFSNIEFKTRYFDPVNKIMKYTMLPSPCRN